MNVAKDPQFSCHQHGYEWKGLLRKLCTVPLLSTRTWMNIIWMWRSPSILSQAWTIMYMYVRPGYDSWLLAYWFILPWVIVSGQADASVAYPGLFGQTDLGNGGHVHHITPPPSEHHTLRFAWESWALDGHCCASIVALQPQLLRCFNKHRPSKLKVNERWFPTL